MVNCGLGPRGVPSRVLILLQVFEYFANEKLPDGSAHMRPQDLLAALVPVYPPEGEQVCLLPCHVVRFTQD